MTPGEQIDQLREQGYWVQVRHYRPAQVWPPGAPHPRTIHTTRRALRELHEQGFRGGFLPKGGTTDVVLARPGLRPVVGQARCRSDDPDRAAPGDQFCYRTGLTIALGRALAKLDELENAQES